MSDPEHMPDQQLTSPSADWFVANVRDLRWQENELGVTCEFDKHRERFPEFGINLTVLAPGQPMTMYHRESAQEGFLVLVGECLLVVEDEEVSLRQWDYFHCPAGVAHTVVGAGQCQALVLAVGNRLGPDTILYPREETALRYHAAAERETASPSEAYARFTRPAPDVPFRETFLPNLAPSNAHPDRDDRQTREGLDAPPPPDDPVRPDSSPGGARLGFSACGFDSRRPHEADLGSAGPSSRACGGSVGHNPEVALGLDVTDLGRDIIRIQGSAQHVPDFPTADQVPEYVVKYIERIGALFGSVARFAELFSEALIITPHRLYA